MKQAKQKQMLLAHNGFLLMATVMAVSAATVVEALVVPSTTTHTIRNSFGASFNEAMKRRRAIHVDTYSSLMVTMTPVEDETDLLSSLPAMSAEIRELNRGGVHNKNKNGRRERKRRQKQISNDYGNNKSNTLKAHQQTKTESTSSKNSDAPTSSELLESIPKLSDILEGRSTLNEELVEKKKRKLTSKHKKEIKIIGTIAKKNKNNIVPTQITSDKKYNTGSAANKEKQARTTIDISLAEPTPQQTAHVLRPWRASYKSSKRTQGRIQKVFFERLPSDQGSHSHAQRILDTLLDTPPEYCNAVNLVCALTYSAKAMGHHRVDHLNKNLKFRKSLQATFDILHELLVVHRDEGLFTPRQLCNVAWAIAKHCDRDSDLLFLLNDKPENNGSNRNQFQGMNVFKDFDSPESRLEETIDEIARQLTSILFEESDENSGVVAGSIVKPQGTKSTFQKPKIKLGEICMACWAYGKLRLRAIPPGWNGPPQMGAVKNQDAIVADWKTGQLGTRRTFDKNNENDDRCYEKEDISVTDKLFDAMGYALCRSTNDDGRSSHDTNVTYSILLQSCTWSELANVGWAFASHGRCQSTESEMLLKAVAQEVASRLKDGTTIVNNNPNHQDFLVRDVTQILWSLGTLQSDNFRLADDLVLLVESLSSNLRLGKKTRSSFAQGRPLRRWSCADLVQTAVAMAHARIDENLLLRAIYEEGNYRLMEGASSSRRIPTLTQLPSARKMSNNNLSLGEDRRTFHPWEASILLWSQARLFLTEQQGIEFDEFAEDAPLFFLKALRESRGSFAKSMIGPQEQANIVWSLVILEKYDSPAAIILIDLIFMEAARSCKENKSMQLEHAHQLWQAYFILEEECPEAVKRVPDWFVSYLKEKWSIEKARFKLSSARHQSLSTTLQLMGVDHINEHDEDIDVAIILQPNAVWVHETDMDEDEINETGDDREDHVSVAVEFDGPNHFTRIRTETQELGDPRSSPEPPRALGHTVLKYRLLRKQGWTVVRIPYYEFDKIPFWASMERQRYLQRKLKTHANIKFSDVDVSEYKTLLPNRKSRFD